MRNIFYTIFLILCAPFSSALAQSATETRVLIAAEQSALGHRLVRAICFTQAGIDINTNMQFVQETRRDINQTVDAMINGGGEYNLAPERDATILTLLSTLEMVWKPLRKGTDNFMMSGNIATEDLLKLSHKAKSLDKMWGNILYNIEAQAAATGDQDKLDLNRMARAAGFQSKHLQEAGKLACMAHLVETEDDLLRLRPSLHTAVTSFDETVFGLTFSNSELQLAIPPSESIQIANFEHWQDWTYLYDTFMELKTSKPDENTLHSLSFDIENMHARLSETSELYRQHAISQAFASFGFDLGG